MYCKNCGAQYTAQDRFCQSCGAPVEVQQQPQQMPPLQQQPPLQQNQYAPMNQQMMMPPKKKHTGLKVFLAFIIIIGLAVGAFLIFKPNIRLFGPKNLGVKYTQMDYQSALAKTGINISFNGLTGQALQDFKDDSKNQELNIEDYNWEFSDYQQRTFTLSPQEATALLNEIAPDFFWFDDVQVKINPDGTMEGSSRLNVDKILDELFPDLKDEIPSELSTLLPSSVNIYSSGTVSIQNNQLTGNPDVFKIGPVNLPEEYMTDESIEIMGDVFSRIYTIIPGLEIYSLGSDANGNFVFDGLIPQTVNVAPKY
ncbi:MAG: zinc ribbon domain-containing protein [Clostridia bacterium]|nr:zinc ribbon domain-containing protein [Clostridia bacterium]MDD3094340.1 zinc ribbon domain-containing protein [Clostridia bacterium]MDD3970912.1 zinc ribbon domain-containing protein [Clostridia bacterium]NLF35758.1 zinc ribbon domain-containing protein [Clostridiaceae bacterium]